MDIIYGILGTLMLYLIVHFLIIQGKRTWEQRSRYEKFITITGIISMSLILLGTMLGE